MNLEEDWDDFKRIPTSKLVTKLSMRSKGMVLRHR